MGFRKNCFLITMGIMALLALIALILLLICKREKRQSTLGYLSSDMQHNLSQRPWQRIGSYENGCPAGWEQLTQDIFPGVTTFCNCNGTFQKDCDGILQSWTDTVAPQGVVEQVVDLSQQLSNPPQSQPITTLVNSSNQLNTQTILDIANRKASYRTALDPLFSRRLQNQQCLKYPEYPSKNLVVH